MRKWETIRNIAMIVLAIIATILVIEVFFNKEVKADDVVTMATLNLYKEETQLKIDELNTTITELKISNDNLQEEINKLKKPIQH